MGNLVNLATMVDPGLMVNLASMVKLASMVAQGFMVIQGSTGNLGSMGNMATMGSKKLPLDVAKYRFNTKDELTITVLALVIRVHGATLMGLKTLKHGATVRN